MKAVLDAGQISVIYAKNENQNKNDWPLMHKNHDYN